MLNFGQIFVCTKTTRPMFIQTVHNSLFRALEKDPVVEKRTGTAFRCVPARNEHCLYPSGPECVVYIRNVFSGLLRMRKTLKLMLVTQ